MVKPPTTTVARVKAILITFCGVEWLYIFLILCQIVLFSCNGDEGLLDVLPAV